MFGLGKKKDGAGGPPQAHDLGQLLTKMSQDPQAHQDAFYKAFLTDNVFMIGDSDTPEQGAQFLPSGSKVRVMQWMGPDGSPFIPIFTSLDEVRKACPPEQAEAGYIAMSGYDALNLTQGGSPVAIDPGNDHCLYLIPPQIAQILDYFDSLQEG